MFEDKVERAQSEDREDIGGIHDEGVASDRQDRGNGIHSEDEVGGFDHQQRHKERSCHPALLALHEEVAAFEVRSNRKEPSENFQNQILVRMNIRFSLFQETNAAVNQNGAEDVNEELEA